MKNLFLSLVALMMCINSLQAKVLLSENFDYSIGSTLSSAAIWQDVATSSTSKIMIIDGAMTYPGYQSAVLGNAIQLKTGRYQDVKAEIDQTTKSVIYSMLINVSTSTEAGDFVCALQSGSGGFFGSKDVLPLAIKSASTDGKFVMGTCYGSASTKLITYTTQEFDYNTNYLVVLEYQIVEAGDLNDHVRLFVNSTNYARPTLNLTGNDLGSEVSTTDGFSGFNIYQGKNFSNKGPKMSIDALKIFTNWDDVFAPVGPTPEIELLPTSELNFRSVVCGIQRTQEINISGKNLTAPINLSGLSSIFTLSQSSVSVEEAQVDGGCNVTISLNATEGSSELGSLEQLRLSTDDGKEVVLVIKWYATATTQFDNINAYNEGGQVASTAYLIKSPMVVTLCFELPSPGDIPYKCVCVQDATGSLILRDDSGALSEGLKVGDQIPYIYGFAKLDLGTVYFIPSLDLETSKGAPINPIDISINEIQANPTKYAGMLVRLINCTFTPSEDIKTFQLKTYVRVYQGLDYLTLRMFAGRDYLNEIIPTSGEVVGCIITGNGRRMAMRTKNDIKGITDALESISNSNIMMWTSKGKLFIDNKGMLVEIYDAVGRFVLKTTKSELQLASGIYVVKCNARTNKIIVD